MLPADFYFWYSVAGFFLIVFMGSDQNVKYFFICLAVIAGLDIMASVIMEMSGLEKSSASDS